MNRTEPVTVVRSAIRPDLLPTGRGGPTGRSLRGKVAVVDRDMHTRVAHVFYVDLLMNSRCTGQSWPRSRRPGTTALADDARRPTYLDAPAARSRSRACSTR